MLDVIGMQILGLAAVLAGAQPEIHHAGQARTPLTAEERGELRQVFQEEVGGPPLLAVLAELTRALEPPAWVFYLHIHENELRLKVDADPSLMVASALERSPWIESARLACCQCDFLMIEATLLPSEVSDAEGRPVTDAARFLLPYGTEAEALARLQARMEELAARHGIEWTQVQAQPAVALSRSFQRVSVKGKAVARTQAWLRLLHELELQRPALRVRQLGVRFARDEPEGMLIVSMEVSAILRKAGAGSVALAPSPERRLPPAALPDPAEVAARDPFHPSRRPQADPKPASRAGLGVP